MRSTRFWTTVTLVSLLLAAPAARADHVVLLDGRTRTGKVVSEDRRFVVLETSLGRLRIARADIAEVVKDDEPDPSPATGTDQPPTPASDNGSSTRPRRVERPPVPAPAPAGEDPAPRPGAEQPDESEPDGAGDEPLPETDYEQESLAASERQENRRRSRVVRRTSPRSVTPTATPRAGGEDPEEVTLAGKDLASVAPGTRLILFEAPHPFGELTGAIELGRRSMATLEMAGVRTAWLTVGSGDSVERRGLRLSQIQRHVTVSSDVDRKHMFDGIDDGDWVRLHLDDGSTKQGRFEGASSDRVFLTVVNDDGSTDQSPVYARHVRTVDGLIQSSTIVLALRSLVHRETVSITMWPDGERVLGRFIYEEFSRTIGLDTDEDGEIDTRVPRKAAIAEMLRVPMTFREAAIDLRRGDVVRVRHSETFDDALVRRATVARVAAVTAYALTLQTDDGAEVIPWNSVRRLVAVAENPETALSKSRERIDPARIETSVPVLPGTSADALSEIDAESGVSAVDDGRKVTHVFFAPPYEGDVFGVRLGEKAEDGIERSPLVFDTVVVPRRSREAVRKPNELHSDTIEGVHVTLLVDARGRVSAIELAGTDDAE